MIKQGLDNALDTVIREVLSGKRTARYKGKREGKSCRYLEEELSHRGHTKCKGPGTGAIGCV